MTVLFRKPYGTGFEQAYSAAVALDAEKIVYHTGFIPSVYYLEGWAERMIEFWTKFMADGRPVPIVLENVWDPYARVLKKIAEAVAHPGFNLCLDIGHAHCYSKETAANVGKGAWQQAQSCACS